MRKMSLGVLAIGFLFTTTAVGARSEPFVYPQEGQSKEKQQKDE